MSCLSVRARLLLILISSVTVIWIFGFFWIYQNSQRQIQELLDRRLMEAARMALSLSASITKGDSHSFDAAQNGGADTSAPTYEHKLSCQIWSLNGELVGRSAGAPSAKLTNVGNGFSEQYVDGASYRVYAIEDADKGIRVMVGDNVLQRQGLIRDLLSGLLLPAVIMVPVIALLIWFSVMKGLMPLRRATAVLLKRDADNLAKMDIGQAPEELQPLISALNGLFEKVVSARERERSFVAYAAHEMRTPLAGLKAQVQIAAKAKDEATRAGALQQAVKAVDRTSRLITQLLAMSRLDAHPEQQSNPWIDLESALRDVTMHLGSEFSSKRIAIESSILNQNIAIDRELFHLAARNLVENALQISPSDSTVRLSVIRDDTEARLCIEDEGPGLSPEEEKLVVKRFVRGRNKSDVGSGLGLAIVTAALERAGATLRLCRPEAGRGLRAEIVLPAHRLQEAVV